MKRLGQCIKALFEEYKFARRFALFWAIGLITFTVIEFFEMNQVETPHATVIVAIIGILSAVIGFYQWHRSNDE